MSDPNESLNESAARIQVVADGLSDWWRGGETHETNNGSQDVPSPANLTRQLREQIGSSVGDFNDAVAAVQATRAEVVSIAASALSAGRLYNAIADGMTAVSATSLPDSAFWVRPNGPDGLKGFEAYRRTGAGPTDYLKIDGLPTMSQVQSIIEVMGRVFETASPWLWAMGDRLGNTPMALHEDGRTAIAKAVIGQFDAANPVTLTRDADGHMFVGGAGLNLSDAVTYTLMDLAGTEFEGAIEVERDSLGMVRRAVMGDGTVREGGSGVSPMTTLTLVEQITLPDGAQGANPAGGFTATGAARLSNRLVVVGNDGRTVEASTVYACSVVILHPDMRKIFREIPCNTGAFPGIGSIQGIAIRADQTIYFIDNRNKTAWRISTAGVKLPGELVFSHDVNCCAYHPGDDGLWVHEVGTTNVHLYSCATGAVLRTLTGISAQTDQLSYFAPRNWLLGSSGNNGSPGTLKIYDASSGVLVLSASMQGSQATEGLWAEYAPDGTGDILIFNINDGAFHIAADPPLALCAIYRLHLGA